MPFFIYLCIIFMVINMKKNEYITYISEKHKIPFTLVQTITDEFINVLIEEIVNNDEVSITNLGTFTKTKITPVNQFSPIDGSKVKNDTYYRLSFKSSKNLINKMRK